MKVFALTHRLINIESITGNELAVGKELAEILRDLCTRFDGKLDIMEVEPNRNNVLATFGNPVVTFSTHMDTVPPFIPPTSGAAPVKVAMTPDQWTRLGLPSSTQLKFEKTLSLSL